MSWNYRLCKKKSIRKYPKNMKNPLPDEEIFNYAFHEVYYDDNGKVNGWTEDSVEPYYCHDKIEREEGSDPVQQIAEVLEKFREALDKPVLDLDELEEIVNKKSNNWTHPGGEI